MKGINEFTAYQIKYWPNEAKIFGKWTPARPMGMDGILRRIKKAWKVFTGRADVLVWFKQ